MWKLAFSLRTRLLLMLCALVFITLCGGVVSLWHTLALEDFLTDIVDKDMSGLAASEKLKTMLVMQKGYVTYYFQDNDPLWIEELNRYHAEFFDWLKKTRKWADSDEERDVLNQIDSLYIRYSMSRDHVLKLYQDGKKEEGFAFQKTIRPQFFEIIRLCQKFEESHENRIALNRKATRDQAQLVNQLALAALLVSLALGLALAYTLLKGVLGPIHELARGNDSIGVPGEDDVTALGRRFQDLMRDVEQTKHKLDWSRAHLQQAEKWALAGKLAAGVAHSVRNPLTSVKMRLFSLERSLALDTSQREDFEVISEEIRHIDTIVNNFLEFSRPPKLKMRITSPSEAVDTAIQLLRHRLESSGVKVECIREAGPLPEISADPDQLKEVIVNLIINACEAMVSGGTIAIREETGESEAIGPVVTIRMTDTGPGVPQNIQSKLFQPFFSTKGEGTGLGLSIATRIIEEHGGWIDLESEVGKGATFIITLPISGEQTWAQSS